MKDNFINPEICSEHLELIETMAQYAIYVRDIVIDTIAEKTKYATRSARFYIDKDSILDLKTSKDLEI